MTELSDALTASFLWLLMDGQAVCLGIPRKRPISCLAMTSVTFCSRITYYVTVTKMKSELKGSIMRTNSDFGGNFQVHVGRAMPNFGFEKSSWS